MVIEFGNNSSASLMVCSNDDPQTLAQKFCFMHNIDPHVIATLTANIRSLKANSFGNASCFKVERNNSSFEVYDDK